MRRSHPVRGSYLNPSHWPISQKVAAGPLILISLLCLVVLFGWSIASTHQQLIDQNYRDRSAYEETALRLPHSLAVIQKDLYKLTIWTQIGVTGPEITSTRDLIDEAIDDVKAMTTKLAALHPVDDLTTTIERYARAVEQTLILIERNPEIGATATRGNERIYLETKVAIETLAASMEDLFDRRLLETRASSKRLVILALGIVGGIGLLTLALALASSRYIALPIRNLAGVVDRFRSGDLDVEIDWTKRQDEIGLVARAMESFRTSLIRNQALEREREQLNQELEKKVEDRTHQLAEQAEQLAEALEKEHELNGLQRQFVSMVCHEFRTPLAIIDGHAQRLLRRRNDISPDRLETSLSKVRTAIVRLTELMESVLSASRLEAGTIRMELAPCNVSAMIEDLASSYREINPTYDITTDVEGLPERFTIDEKLMRQVVSNLLSNAIKYSPDSAEVRIQATTSDDGGISIAVRDQGLGIPKAELERLFERFFRASTSVGIAGTGIGLHMVKALVDMHDGRVEVDSEEGVGTTFSVHLPHPDTNRKMIPLETAAAA